LLFRCVCLLFARRRVVGGWSLAYPVEDIGSGCDAELRVVRRVCFRLPLWFVCCTESRVPMSVIAVGQRDGLADWWSMMEGS
jgi:hypothetical protein